MQNIKQLSKKIIGNKWFEILIVFIIIVNSIFIGVETYYTNAIIKFIEHIILLIFTFEIATRFVARESIKSFFKSGWNIFDLFLVIISYVPEDMFEGGSTFMVIRILRVFRVLRLLRTSGEIKLIIGVLTKSFSALFYNAVFFFIFIYLFAIIGVSLFKLPTPDTMTTEQQALYVEMQNNAWEEPMANPDPYGSLGEAMFTLFRAMTGSWVDLRYNLVIAHNYGFIHTPTAIITVYHVIWFILAAFLLLNLVVGAVVNNYQVIMNESRREQEESEKKKLE